MIDTNITPRAVEKKQRSSSEPPVFYGTKDVAQLLGCSIPTAREIMQRPDFPLVMVGKSMRVYKEALIKWAMERRV